MYHRVNDCWNSELDVTVQNFTRQMDYLKEKNYKVISMDEAYNKMISGQIRDKYVVITFDDGYSDFIYNAYPILKHYNFPAIIFIVPEFIDTSKVFGWDKHIKHNLLMSWNQIINLDMDANIDFGSHTLTHSNVDCVDEHTLNYELHASKNILEQKLCRKIRHFAYPTGVHTKLSEYMVKKYYDTGLLIYQGKKITRCFNVKNRAKLKRIPIRRSDDKLLFTAKIKGWLIIEDTIKHLLGRP